MSEAVSENSSWSSRATSDDINSSKVKRNDKNDKERVVSE